MSKLEFVIDFAEFAMENPAVKHAAENAAKAGARLLESAGEHVSGAKFVTKVLEDSWAGSAFQKLAGTQKSVFEEAAAGRISVAKSATLPMTTNVFGQPMAALHPVVSAALRGDTELVGGVAADRLWKATRSAETELGLMPRALDSTKHTAGLMLRDGPDVQMIGQDVKLQSFSQGGFTPGYIHNLEAYARIADRYNFDLDALSRIKIADARGYSSDGLRQIESFMRLEKNSLRYEPEGLTLHDRGVKKVVLPGDRPVDAGIAPEVPPRFSSTSIQEQEHKGDLWYKYNIGGRDYQLYTTDNFWLHPSGWKGTVGASGKPDFKFHLLGQSADSVRALQDRLIPSLYNDPEWKDILRSWKSVVPDMRSYAGEFSGQHAKTFTIYPGSEDTVARVAHKLRETLDGLPLTSLNGRTKVADRVVFGDMPITMAQESYPMIDAGKVHAVPFNADINLAIRHDSRMGTIGPYDRVSPRRLGVLEELTGTSPGTLAVSNDGVIGVGTTYKVKPNGKLYLEEGNADRGGSPSERGYRYSGYTGRWALNVVGGRYGIDPVRVVP